MKRTHLVIFSAALGAIVAAFAMTIFLWNQIPDVIPTHFNASGAVDAWGSKTIWMLFLLPLLNIVMFAVFALLYKYPQYTNWPTTLILMTVDEQKREPVFHVLREMLVWLLLAISAMFAYLQYIILATANGRANGLQPWIMITFLVGLGVVLVYVNVRMLVTVKRLVKKS